VRRQLLPLMESFNPKVVEGLARTAEVLREEGAALDGATARLLELACENETSSSGGTFRHSLQVDLLAGAQPGLRRRALRQWISQRRGDLRRVERVHILAVESLLFGDRGGRVIELPGGGKISRKRRRLEFVAS
jgi:tRNA(Ile)-lysidine synthase